MADTVLGEISDITAAPSIYKDRVFITTQAGRSAALQLENGNLLWESSFGSRNSLAFSGNHFFILSEDAKLMAVDIDSGGEIWVKALPRYDFEPTRRGFIAWHGPLLAGVELFGYGCKG